MEDIRILIQHELHQNAVEILAGKECYATVGIVLRDYSNMVEYNPIRLLQKHYPNLRNNLAYKSLIVHFYFKWSIPEDYLRTTHQFYHPSVEDVSYVKN